MTGEKVNPNKFLVNYSVVFQVISALDYLHQQLQVIHRDVKPSNILINREGRVKMCDFGISGYLVDSVAKTIDAGCKPYMAVSEMLVAICINRNSVSIHTPPNSFFQPERIDPQGNPSQYDVRSDVWSFGISMIEISTGIFPYKTWTTPFEQLRQVVMEAPPTLPPNRFTHIYEDFINKS